jgi:hypothetical protein
MAGVRRLPGPYRFRSTGQRPQRFWDADFACLTRCRAALRRRSRVLAEAQRVRRVVLVLQGHQPLTLPVSPEEVLDSLLTLVATLGMLAYDHTRSRHTFPKRLQLEVNQLNRLLGTLRTAQYPILLAPTCPGRALRSSHLRICS